MTLSPIADRTDTRYSARTQTVNTRDVKFGVVMSHEC